MSDDTLPKTLEEALARGFTPIEDLDHFLGHRLQMSRNQFDLDLSDHHKLAPDCGSAPKGTACFNRCYPNHVAVSGFCDPNGNCKLYSGSC